MKRAGAGILPQRMVSSKQHPLDFLSVCACRGGLMSLHRKRIACSAAPRLKGPRRSSLWILVALRPPRRERRWWLGSEAECEPSVVYLKRYSCRSVFTY